MDKQFILDAIKRTTLANDNKPLGREKFFRETGIKVSDWAGKYWTKWSDAVQEAGFEHTNRLRTALDKNELIKKFIGLMRELGKFPTTIEIKFKARNTPGFPWHNTFARFGSKQQIAAQILDYCEKHQGYEDIKPICMAIIKERPVKENTIEPEINDGIVYLMKSGRYYKIGFTNDLARREREIKIELPEKLETVHWFRTDDASGLEAYWKNRFKAKCKNGEWFELSLEDIRAFKRRKTFM